VQDLEEGVQCHNRRSAIFRCCRCCIRVSPVIIVKIVIEKVQLFTLATIFLYSF